MAKRSWKPPYEWSMVLVNYVRDDGECTTERVGELWYKTFLSIARYLDFSKKESRFLWRELVYGNWDRLHMTDEEKAKTPGQWLEELADEVWYCSDRWSMDRLTKCHWLYRAYTEASGTRFK